MPSTTATSRVASAPGKIMLAGEYAVLHGHAAVLAAVDRRAVAHFGERPSPSRLIHHLADIVAESDAEAGRRARTIEVDSSALFDAETKLGLGSSAAVASCAAALALGTSDREPVLSLAHEAHGRAQAERGARGSGADIGVSVYGGVVAVRAAGVGPLEVSPRPWPEGLSMVAVWTGVAADTAPLVAAVAAGRERNRSGYDTAIAAIAAACHELLRALDAADVRACVAAVQRGADAHAALADATGVPLVIPAHRQVRALAASRGGAAKPTGAGGGDVALAVFADPDAAAAFRGDLALAGLREIELHVTTTGVTVSPG